MLFFGGKSRVRPWCTVKLLPLLCSCWIARLLGTVLPLLTHKFENTKTKHSKRLVVLCWQPKYVSQFMMLWTYKTLMHTNTLMLCLDGGE